MLRRELEYFLGALRFFTRLPVPAWVGHSERGLQAAARWLPVVGLVVGGFAALAYLAAAQFWPQPVAVLLAMVTALGVTGGFHEDGLSDTADGLGGGWDKAKILAIMKDSRVGSYGVLALLVVLPGKFLLLASLPAAQVVPALLFGHALSRCCALLPMATMDYARADDSSKARPLAGRLSPAALLPGLLALLPGLFWLPPGNSLLAVILALLVSLWLARKCARWLGGYTGDTLGATQQLAEIACYLGLLARWPV